MKHQGLQPSQLNNGKYSDNMQYKWNIWPILGFITYIGAVEGPHVIGTFIFQVKNFDIIWIFSDITVTNF